jgi:DNA-binding CsgD family transcriptional regulator
VAEALLAAGRRDRAEAAAEADWAQARRWGTAAALGTALRVRGLVRRGDAGLADLEAAAAELDGTQHRLDHARALLDLGAARRLAREPSAARPPLYRAVELADAAGATLLAERARTELRLTGARAPRGAAASLDALTAAERRVAELVAAGQGNDAVAQSLFVTRRTVETHLTAVYRKLGISGRRELAAALAGDR